MQRLAIFGFLVLGIATMAAPVGASDTPAVDRAFAVVVKVEQTAIALAQKQAPSANVAVQLQGLQDSIDFEAFAQITLGKYWPAASAQERRDFLQVLHTLLVNEIVRRAGLRRGGSLERLSGRLLDNGDLLLSTRRTVPNATPTVVDWRLRQTRSTIRIVDIIVDGWSVATSARQDFVGQLNLNGGSIGMLTVALRDRTLRPF